MTIPSNREYLFWRLADALADWKTSHGKERENARYELRTVIHALKHAVAVEHTSFVAAVARSRQKKKEAAVAATQIGTAWISPRLAAAGAALAEGGGRAIKTTAEGSMISTKLANVSDAMLFDAMRGVSMPPDRAAKIAEMLLDLSKQVQAMEDGPVPLRKRLPMRRPTWLERIM